ncbi:hypothetical protein N566_06620 [Streptomycetaceae bacterium MP113-05]|nr:hypothetical protein N566_06620 [Streptomycetaceae bacterium MP113-05]
MAKQARSERTVERLMVSAAGAFAVQGFARATLAEVSSAAGVTKGALFFHFSTKDELADAVQARARDVLESVVEDMRGADQGFLQTAVDLTHVLHRLLREDTCVQASVRITRERRGPAGATLGFYPLWWGRLGKLLGEARRNGELAPSVTDLSARTLVTAAVTGVEALVWMETSPEEAQRWLKDLWALVLPLLAAPGADIRTAPPSVMLTPPRTAC